MAESVLVHLSEGPLDVSGVHTFLRDPACGGVCVFVGTTRDVHEGRPVAQLSYEAYGPMAEKELRGLAAEVRERFPGVVRVALVHRVGEVPLAEASVVVGVSAPHREEAFAACRHGIDALKARIPIWKKESYRDGSDPRWVANRESGSQVSS